MMIKSFGRMTCLALFLCGPAIVFAAEQRASDADIVPASLVEDRGAANRIEAGDRLRVLSQTVPAAVCHLHNGVAVDLAATQIVDSLAEFDLLTSALLDGDSILGIEGAEERRRTRMMITDLQAAWAPMRAAAESIVADPTNAVSAKTAYDLATALLDQSYALLSQIEGQYSNPTEILATDTMLLEISGRQSMMTQRLAFLACRMWSGAADANYAEKLQQAGSQFEAGFNALIFGAPGLGVSPPPTEEIAAALDAVAADCATVISKLQNLVATGQKDPAQAAELYRILTEKTDEMDMIAHLYAVHSKRVY